MMVDRNAYRFFFEHAGYIVGERAKCAIALARAESLFLEAESEGLAVCVWTPDEDGPCFDGPYEECEWACIRFGGEVRAALGGITDADSNYRRVVRAELASECAAGLRAALVASVEGA